MKKALIIFGYTILGLVIVGVGIYLYIFRSQEIDLTYIPKEFTYCGKQIWGKDKEYKEIITWLKQNKVGWKFSYVTYVPRQVYHYPSFVVNVLEGAVVVSYKTDYGYPQYIKTINHDLKLTCVKSS